jgi:hypothetical protein
MGVAEVSRGRDAGLVAVRHDEPVDVLHWAVLWTCEKWSEDACDWVRRKLELPSGEEIRSAVLRTLIPDSSPDFQLAEIPGNLLLNEGIARLLDLLIAAGGTAYNNANAYIGVGDTSTAEAATQTELQATQNAANRFYKAMNATYPSRTNQTVTWQSDFTSSEANLHWQEWTVAAGATTASGSGFLVGTTNLNRKVSDLGTKATGTWTLSGAVTIS